MEMFKKIQFVSVATLLFACTSVFATPADDAAIQKDVSTRIAADKTSAGSDVKVRAHDGIVILTGITRTGKEAAILVETATATPGVADVDTTNLKTTKSEHPLEDTFVTAKVKGEFLKNKLFGDTPTAVTTVSVETKNDVVFLTGTAATQAQAENAIRLAKGVKGVKKVTSTITVTPTGTTATPASTTATPTSTTTTTPAAIRR